MYSLGNLTDKKGEDFQDFVISNDMTILNTSIIPTYETTRCQGFIDLTIFTNFIADEIIDWCVKDDFYHLDYKYISISIKTHEQDTRTFRDP